VKNAGNLVRMSDMHLHLYVNSMHVLPSCRLRCCQNSVLMQMFQANSRLLKHCLLIGLQVN
jgi:hypothetical protein